MTIDLAFFDTTENQKKIIENQFKNDNRFELHFNNKSLDKHTADEIKGTQGIGVFIQSEISREILDLLPDLKVIATMSTGFDHIDMKECKKRDITICNVPAYGDNTVAEYAFGLILALARKLKPTFDRVERGIFNRTGLEGMDIKGKTLGLIGTGKIGTHVAKLASAFEMKLIAYDIKPDKVLEKKYDIEYTDLEDLSKRADVISLHVPYNESTHHLINSELINLFKPNVLLVNTSRGKVVNTEAIVNALREGKLGGVALDTFEGEEVWIEEEFLRRDDLAAIPLRQAMENFFILRSEKAILTPHNAFNTKEALDRILITSAENLKAYFEGRTQNKIQD